MKRVLILVEGQTEEKFVNEVLAPHLADFDKWPEATCICTKRVQRRRAYRGGIGSYSQVKRDIQRLLQSNPAQVTTLIDYYGLPSDFPGYEAAQSKMTSVKRVQCIEEAFAADIDDTRFIPNLAVHEFEAFLFSKPETIADVLIDASLGPKLIKIAEEFLSPEDIDDSPETAPSKRIEALYPGYEKPLHGPIIAQKIGLNAIRERCAHFNQWLRRLEG